MIETTKGNEVTDGLGYTELEWERMWNSEYATGTVYRSRDDDESYCEGCDQTVEYGPALPAHGKCGCN